MNPCGFLFIIFHGELHHPRLVKFHQAAIAKESGRCLISTNQYRSFIDPPFGGSVKAKLVQTIINHPWCDVFYLMTSDCINWRLYACCRVNFAESLCSDEGYCICPMQSSANGGFTELGESAEVERQITPASFVRGCNTKQIPTGPGAGSFLFPNPFRWHLLKGNLAALRTVECEI